MKLQTVNRLSWIACGLMALGTCAGGLSMMHLARNPRPGSMGHYLQEQRKDLHEQQKLMRELQKQQIEDLKLQQQQMREIQKQQLEQMRQFKKQLSTKGFGSK